MTNKELIKIREEKNLTKGQFAALIGISAMLQGRYESGKIAIPENIEKKVMELAAVKTVKDAAEDKAAAAAKDAAKETSEKAVKASGKKNVKDAEEKAAKEEVKAAAAKEVKKAVPAKAKAPMIFIESLLGGRISTEEILKRLPEGVNEVYVKPEENKAYWVKGKKTGDIDLW